MNPKSIWTHRLSSRLQAFALVAAMALMLGFTGGLLGGETMALAVFTAVIVLYALQPFLAPRLMLRVQGGRPLTPPEAPELHGIVRELAHRAQLPRPPQLYYLPGGVMNAFTMGTGRRAVIGVTNALLRHLQRDEVAAVLAHEMAHLKNDDTRVMGFAALLSQLIQGISLFGQLLLIVNLPLILAGHHFLSMGGLLLLILAPYIGFLLQLALSRSREYLADLEAAALLGTAHPLAAALVKIERHNRLLQRRFLRWPLAAPPKDSLLRTHPPTRERVRRLMTLQDADRVPEALPSRPGTLRRPFRRPVPETWLDRCRAYGYCH